MLRKPTLILLTMALLAGAFVAFINLVPKDIGGHITSVLHGEISPTADRTPGELLRHARQRLAGHPKLEFVALPVLDVIQPYFERPVPLVDISRLGKGQNLSLSANPVTADYLVSDVEQLAEALRRASAGQMIELLPGVYRVSNLMGTRNPGLVDRRITVRASPPNAAVIEVDGNEGFQVSQPNWTFENLKIVGVCKSDDSCEHAFHVVGAARNTIIRNNRLEDFSAHIKINGFAGEWPDGGLIEHNTLINTRPRHTSRPVTPVDLVGASQWLVADNYVANFVKADPKATAYGIFMKGAGVGGRIERNLIVCSLNDLSQPGTRVGLSFGGGGSGPAYCRDGACEVEFSGGRAVNNIIAHCNDFGIDVNRSRASFLAHNTLINTAGIDVRGEHASAIAFGNLFEGRARARKGGRIQVEMNETGSMSEFFSDPDQLDLQWRRKPENIPSHAKVREDFCQRPRAEGTPPGALESKGPC